MQKLDWMHKSIRTPFSEVNQYTMEYPNSSYDRKMIWRVDPIKWTIAHADRSEVHDYLKSPFLYSSRYGLKFSSIYIRTDWVMLKEHSCQQNLLSILVNSIIFYHSLLHGKSLSVYMIKSKTYTTLSIVLFLVQHQIDFLDEQMDGVRTTDSVHRNSMILSLIESPERWQHLYL